MKETNLQKISTIVSTPKGVEVILQGDVKIKNVEDMIQNCKTKEQNCCDLEFMSKLNQIDVSGQDKKVTIELEGEITTSMVENNLSKCQCYVAE